MSLEEEVSSVLSVDSVERVIFEEGDTGTVHVMYDSHEFWSAWPHGDDRGTHEEKEEYFQEQLGVGWAFRELLTGTESQRGGIYMQVAVFER